MRPKRPSFGLKPLFQFCRAIAVVAGPGLSPVRVAATAASVRVLYFRQFEKSLPVRTFFLQRRVAVTDLDPLHSAVLQLAGFSHIPKILVTGDGASPECSVFDCMIERFFFPGPDLCSNEIAHRQIVS